MKKLLILVLFIFTVFNLSGQIYKFKSEKAALTDYRLNSTNYNETAYLTFDFNNKMVTIKIGTGSNPQVFNFKMIRSVFEKGTMMGDCYKIYISGNLPRLKDIESVSFNPNLPSVWFDGPSGTLLFSVSPI